MALKIGRMAYLLYGMIRNERKQIMVLYHGSNVEVKEPRLLKVQRELDFGKGFYTTTDLEQAIKWAKRTSRRLRCEKGYVSAYEIEDTLDGKYDEEEAIKRLLPQKLKDQYTLKTDTAIRLLQFKEGIEV